MSDQVDELLSDGSAAAPPLSFIHELQTAVTAEEIHLRAASDDC